MKWTGPCDDGRVWYVIHVPEPVFEAHFSADPEEAKAFKTKQEAEKTASHWKVLRGRKPKEERPLPFEIVERRTS